MFLVIDFNARFGGIEWLNIYRSTWVVYWKTRLTLLGSGFIGTSSVPFHSALENTVGSVHHMWTLRRGRSKIRLLLWTRCFRWMPAGLTTKSFSKLCWSDRKGAILCRQYPMCRLYLRQRMQAALGSVSMIFVSILAWISWAFSAKPYSDEVALKFFRIFTRAEQYLQKELREA